MIAVECVIPRCTATRRLAVVDVVDWRDSEAGRDLSDRQRELLRLLVAGRSNPQIARALCISEHTVHQHLKIIYARLGARNRVQAAVAALRRGLV